jgi:hypothetical protein
MLLCGHATVKRDDDSSGHAITADPHECEAEWEKRGKVRGVNAVWHARIITFMAGAEAQEVCRARGRALGDGDDQYQVALMMEHLYPPPPDPERVEARLRTMTRALVRRHKVLIERVAGRLLAQGSLSAAELDRLVGRSLDDIRPNAPLLLWLQQHEEA